MVRRSTDAPRGVVDTINAQRANLDEVSRAQGRGTTALRDASGNVLQMNPDARYPLLTAASADSAVAFTEDGVVKIMSPDTAQDRDMTVRHITSSGDVRANNFSATGNVTVHTFNSDNGAGIAGTIFTDRVSVTGNIGANSANFGPLVAGQTQLGNLICAQINTGGAIYAPGQDINTDPNGAMHSLQITCGNLNYGTLTGPPSERSLKDHIEDITDGLSVITRLNPARWTWKPGVTVAGASYELDRREHVGIYVDELADAAPAAIRHQHETSDETSGARAYEDRALLAYLVSAVQQLDEKNKDLERRLARLEGNEETEPPSPA